MTVAVGNVAPEWLRVEVGGVLVPCLLMHIYGSALQARTGTDTKLLGFCHSPVRFLLSLGLDALSLKKNPKHFNVFKMNLLVICSVILYVSRFV